MVKSPQNYKLTKRSNTFQFLGVIYGSGVFFGGGVPLETIYFVEPKNKIYSVITLGQRI